MKTELNGDWLGYAKRFRLPSIKTFIYPLKTAGIIFIVGAILTTLLHFIPNATILKVHLHFAVLMVAIYFYIKVHYRQFWDIVLEESKGLFADLLMWLYYVVICLISITPTFYGLVTTMNR